MAAKYRTFRARFGRIRTIFKSLRPSTLHRNSTVNSAENHQDGTQHENSRELKSLKPAASEGDNDMTVPSDTPEPYLTWLSFTLGVGRQSQLLPNIESRDTAAAVDQASLVRLESEVDWPFDEFPVPDQIVSAKKSSSELVKT